MSPLRGLNRKFLTRDGHDARSTGLANANKRSRRFADQMMEKQTDDQVTVPMVTQAKKRFPELNACSFDKGFHSQENQRTLKGQLELVALPRKGKLSQQAQTAQQSPEFVMARRALGGRISHQRTRSARPRSVPRSRHRWIQALRRLGRGGTKYPPHRRPLVEAGAGARNGRCALRIARSRASTRRRKRADTSSDETDIENQGGSARLAFKETGTRPSTNENNFQRRHGIEKFLCLT